MTFDRGDRAMADVPWLLRARLGAWPAFWQTVFGFVRHPGKLAREVRADVDVDPYLVVSFRRRCVWMASISLAVMAVVASLAEAAGATPQHKRQIAFVGTAFGLGLLPFAAMFFFLTSRVFDDSGFDNALDTRRFRLLHEFAAAPLALFFVLPPLQALLLFFIQEAADAVVVSLALLGGALLIWFYLTLAYTRAASRRNVGWFATQFMNTAILWTMTGLFCGMLGAMLGGTLAVIAANLLH